MNRFFSETMENYKQWIIEKTKRVINILVNQVNELKEEDITLEVCRSYIQEKMKSFIDVCIPAKVIKEKRYIVIKDKYKHYEAFQCAICTFLFYKPVLTPCGHIFCEDCLKRSLKTFRSCPMCRHEIREETVKKIPAEYLGEIYTQLVVRCPICRFKTTVGDYKRHLEKDCIEQEYQKKYLKT